MNVQQLQLVVDGKQLTAMMDQPESGPGEYTFIYAPGAGSNINDGFGKFLSNRLASMGISAIRIQFPYMEAKKRRPDPPRLLEDTWRAALLAVPTGTKVVIGGRSLGGRVASLVVSKGAEVDGLALFAYPLRPPTNPTKSRDEHFPSIGVPTFFCSGTRDSFATPEELEAAANIVPTSTVYLLDGADHGFEVLKSSGRAREDVWRDATEQFITWLNSQVCDNITQNDPVTPLAC